VEKQSGLQAMHTFAIHFNDGADILGFDVIHDPVAHSRDQVAIPKYGNVILYRLS